MKPTEFRIGNYFHPATGRMPSAVVAKIQTLLFECVEWVRMDQVPAQVETWPRSNYREMHPIRLTEEWLLKFGLKNENGFFKWHRSAIYQRQGTWIYGILAYDNRSYYHVSELKYVHQLQNLYFALTGEELKC